MTARPSPQPRFAPQNVFPHVCARLTLSPPPHWRGVQSAAAGVKSAGFRPAAVLIGLAAYASEVQVLLTQRTAVLKDHSGQIAFPGGKIERGDQSPAAAALREAQEEIGLDPSCAELLGYLDPYRTGTGYCVIPVVASLATPIILNVNTSEVDEVFEVPFAFLMDAANHELHHKEFSGKLRRFHAISYGTRYIWGVTADILRNLYERLYC